MPTASTVELLTSPRTTMGTMAYMSPEPARGEEFDTRTDLVSFGSVLYEMVISRMAFPGKTTGVVLRAILNQAPVASLRLNPEVPAELERIISKAVGKDRSFVTSAPRICVQT